MKFNNVLNANNKLEFNIQKIIWLVCNANKVKIFIKKLIKRKIGILNKYLLIIIFFQNLQFAKKTIFVVLVNLIISTTMDTAQIAVM